MGRLTNRRSELTPFVASVLSSWKMGSRRSPRVITGYSILSFRALGGRRPGVRM